MDGPKEIINKFGGVDQFATALNLDIRNARKIRERNAIPMKHWPAIVAIAKEKRWRDVTFERLAELHAA